MKVFHTDPKKILIIDMTPDITNQTSRIARAVNMNSILKKRYKALDIQHLIVEHFPNLKPQYAEQKFSSGSNVWITSQTLPSGAVYLMFIVIAAGRNPVTGLMEYSLKDFEGVHYEEWVVEKELIPVDIEEQVPSEGRNEIS